MLIKAGKRVAFRLPENQTKPRSVNHGSRLMTMSALYPSGKPCSTGTHNEAVTKLALFSAFDQNKNAVKTTLSRHLINEAWYKSEEGSSFCEVNAK